MKNKRIKNLVLRILFFSFLFLTENLFAQTKDKIGQINDPDGYTNIRKEANTKSQIIGKILKNDYFFYEDYNSNWCKVSTQDNKKGFVHKSRIIHKKSDDVFIIKVTDYKNNSLKDSILDISIKRNEELPPFFIEGFDYPKIKPKTIEPFFISFCNNEIKVKISKKKANIKNYTTKIVEMDGKKYIDIIPEKGFKVSGVDIDFPKYEVYDIEISMNNSNYKFSKTDIKYLFEPNLEDTKLFKKDNNQYFIYLSGGDGVARYYVIFLFDKNKMLKKYILEN